MHFRSFRKHLRDVWARRPRKQTCIRTSHGAQRLSITRPTCILAAVKGFRCIWVKGCQNDGFLRIWIWPPRSTLQLFASYLPQSWEWHAIWGEEDRKRTLLAWYWLYFREIVKSYYLMKLIAWSFESKWTLKKRNHKKIQSLRLNGYNLLFETYKVCVDLGFANGKLIGLESVISESQSSRFWGDKLENNGFEEISKLRTKHWDEKNWEMKSSFGWASIRGGSFGPFCDHPMS